MSIRSASQKRRTEARRRTARNRNIITAVAGLIAVGTILLMVAGTTTDSSTPSVDSSRLELDPVLGNPDAPVTII